MSWGTYYGRPNDSWRMPSTTYPVWLCVLILAICWGGSIALGVLVIRGVRSSNRVAFTEECQRRCGKRKEDCVRHCVTALEDENHDRTMDVLADIMEELGDDY